MPERSSAAAGPVTARGSRTRARIVDAALELFLTNGYERTTMRAIAESAGVSLGNAYYYFRSKEELIQAFYRRTHEEHLAVCDQLLASEHRFRKRLEAVIVTKIETSMPYHEFAGVLFRNAADPASPLSPFSPESAPLRRESTALLSEVVSASDARPAKRLAAHLPNLLWLYQMGVLMYWVHDKSEDCRMTYKLIDSTVVLVDRLVQLSKLPVLRPLTNSTVELMEHLRAS